MAFRKTGVVPIGDIKCSCGHDIKGHIKKCPKCGKNLIPEALQTTVDDLPDSLPKDKSKVK